MRYALTYVTEVDYFPAYNRRSTSIISKLVQLSRGNRASRDYVNKSKRVLLVSTPASIQEIERCSERAA